MPFRRHTPPDTRMPSAHSRRNTAVSSRQLTTDELGEYRERAQAAIIALLAKCVEQQDPYTRDHGEQVSQYARLAAERLSLTEVEMHVATCAALLHDVGKVGVRQSVLNKPGPLLADERAHVETHVRVGYEMLNEIPALEHVAEAVLHHHERFDGTGYPDRSPGEHIPWLGRLLAVAVSYAENCGGGRDPLAIVQRGSGSAFDPEAVRALTRYRPLSLDRQEREISLPELRSGMVLAQGVHTANGLLLIPEGQILSEPYIDKLRNHNRVNPITEALRIYC